jgi:hypothetical protein
LRAKKEQEKKVQHIRIAKRMRRSGTVESSVDEVDMNHNYLQNPIILAADWVGFLLLLLSAIVLAYKLMKFKGPTDQPEDYFFG